MEWQQFSRFVTASIIFQKRRQLAIFPMIIRRQSKHLPVGIKAFVWRLILLGAVLCREICTVPLPLQLFPRCGIMAWRAVSP